MRIARKLSILCAVITGQLALAGEQSATTVEADSSSRAWAAYARKTAFKVHPLVTVAGVVLGSTSSSTVLVVPLEMEIAAAPNVSLYGIVAPTVVSSGSQSAFGAALNAGLRVYVAGRAPDGLWAGGQLGATWLTSGTASTVNFDLQPQIGYQWITDSGFTIGVGAGLSLAALANQDPSFTLVVPLGFAW